MSAFLLANIVKNCSDFTKALSCLLTLCGTIRYTNELKEFSYIDTIKALSLVATFFEIMYVLVMLVAHLDKGQLIHYKTLVSVKLCSYALCIRGAMT